MIDAIRKRLLDMKDGEYKSFQCSLMPTVSPESVIGVRTPFVRKLAREIYKSGEYGDFLADLPHKYYEENNLHAFIIEQIGDFKACINELERFLPYVDNWATCDSMSPKIFKKHTDELFAYIQEWIRSEHTYTARYAIKTLMSFYSAEHFEPSHLYLVASVKSQEYYVRMAIAWYFATELAFNYDETLSVLEKQMLDPWIHNKTVQKAIESFRVTDEHKKHLKTLVIRSC